MPNATALVRQEDCGVESKQRSSTDLGEAARVGRCRMHGIGVVTRSRSRTNADAVEDKERSTRRQHSSEAASGMAERRRKECPPPGFCSSMVPSAIPVVPEAASSPALDHDRFGNGMAHVDFNIRHNEAESRTLVFGTLLAPHVYRPSGWETKLMAHIFSTPLLGPVAASVFQPLLHPLFEPLLHPGSRPVLQPLIQPAIQPTSQPSFQQPFQQSVAQRGCELVTGYNSAPAVATTRQADAQEAPEVLGNHARTPHGNMDAPTDSDSASGRNLGVHLAHSSPISDAEVTSTTGEADVLPSASREGTRESSPAVSTRNGMISAGRHHEDIGSVQGLIGFEQRAREKRLGMRHMS
ncbi:hypothetical protein HPB50_003349 [Hyalomma asiaticum]|uniref:Uncharacterized protein n=1 Tax=Hyalomma asiaticum TaxID=266040 RepID=A0ACB7TCD1_HYAAI|nr:hypothetical protein HPB50_003349 [Hyalomma asiaticum]